MLPAQRNPLAQPVYPCHIPAWRCGSTCVSRRYLRRGEERDPESLQLPAMSYPLSSLRGRSVLLHHNAVNAYSEDDNAESRQNHNRISPFYR